MKVNNVEYSRIFNLGNYESETIKISLAIDEEDTVTAQEAIKFARTEAGKASLSYERLQAKKKASKEVSGALSGQGLGS